MLKIENLHGTVGALNPHPLQGERVGFASQRRGAGDRAMHSERNFQFHRLPPLPLKGARGFKGSVG